MIDWRAVADRSIRDEPPSPETSLAVLQAGEGEFLRVLDAAYRVRRHFHGKSVKIHVLLNAKSGLCPEDCGFCSQSSVATGEIDRYKLLSKEEMVDAARKARDHKAWKFCIVTSTRGPSEKELDTICAAVREIKRDVGIRVCTSLGNLREDQAVRLKEAGVDRFNHNLETTERRFPEVCTTHTWKDRWDTVQLVQKAGMEACSGGIIGMGESDEEIVEMAFAARRSGATSIPVNFLDPRPGTPLSRLAPPDPRKSLLVLCLFRFVNPSRDIRIAGGRELHLRSLQPLGLYAANSVFVGDYLTTKGQPPEADYRMIEELGFVVTRHEGSTSYMADGYARTSGKVGVAMATSGPGATNLVTGICTAMMDSVPTVFITGQVAAHLIGGDAFQETDVTGITLPITKHNYLVTRADQIAETIREAFYIARSGRPGPVLIDICKNAQVESTEFIYPEEVKLPGYQPVTRSPRNLLDQAVALIEKAKKPMNVISISSR